MLENVDASAKTYNNDIDFKYIIEHVLSCTLEKVDEDVSYCDGLRFGTINEAFNIERLRFHWGEEPCLEWGKAWE